MPFNGSGTFTRLRNWVSDAAGGIKIRADYHDQEDDGFAAGISNCIARDGQSVVTANIPFNAKRLTNVADPVNDQDAMTKKWGQTNLISGAHVADTPPAAAQAGNLWWDSNEGNLYLKYNDGTSTQWVQVNVSAPVAKPPEDGNEYAMINGVWVLKSQNIDLTGLALKDVTVPAWGPTTVRWTLSGAPNGSVNPYLRVSFDGTTFRSGASDYSTGGYYHGTGTLAFQNSPWAASAYIAMCHTGDVAGGLIFSNGWLQISCPPPFSYNHFQLSGDAYSTPATNLMIHFTFAGGVNNGAPIKALRFGVTTNTFAGGKLTLEWLP